jgi:hypothetical protein
MKQPFPQTKWLRKGKFEVHTVVLTSSQSVTTIYRDRAWNGPISEFFKQFKSVPQ